MHDPYDKMEAHYCFPKRFEEEFEAIGINIHMPHFMMFLEKRVHQKLHSRGYNAAWARFFKEAKVEGRKITPEAIYKELGKLLQQVPDLPLPPWITEMISQPLQKKSHRSTIIVCLLGLGLGLGLLLVSVFT